MTPGVLRVSSSSLSIYQQVIKIEYPKNINIQNKNNTSNTISRPVPKKVKAEKRKGKGRNIL
jgi:hypothetical protein